MEAQGNQENLLHKIPGADEYHGKSEQFYEFVISGLEREAGADARGMMALLQGKSQADIVMARNAASTPYNYLCTESQYITQSRCQNRRNAAGQVVRQCVNVQKTPATGSRSRKPNEWRCTAILVRLIVRWRDA